MPGIALWILLAPLPLIAGPQARKVSPPTSPSSEPVVAAESDSPVARLDGRYELWLQQVRFLITEQEREYFRSLTEDFRREAFIERFWAERDPEPRTGYNELKRRWEGWVAQSFRQFGNVDDDRAKVLLLNGPPGRFALPNGRVVGRCFRPRQEVEVWFYGGSELTHERFILIFYKPQFPGDAPYKVWRPTHEIRPRNRGKLPTTRAADLCSADLWAAALSFIASDSIHYFSLLDRILTPPLPRSLEWVATFAAMSTDLPPGATVFPAEIDYAFPGRNQNRTAVQGIVSIEPSQTGFMTAPGGVLRSFLLTGEVIRDDRLFESFRYRFDVPERPAETQIPLVFRRYMRPGEVEVRVKLEDLHGRAFAYLASRFEVPEPEGLTSVRTPPAELAYFGLLGEANAAAERGQQMIRLVPPEEGQIQLGMVRFTTVSAGEFDKVQFLLNDQPILTKTRPPFSVELNLGGSAAAWRLRAVALDSDGEAVASDEIMVNQGGQRFRVRLTEPRPERTYRESLSAVVQVAVPDGETLERVEIFLNEQRMATLFQEPFVQPLLLENDQLAYVRAVGYLEDGNTSEDVVFINTPDYFERVEVQYVELYAGVFGRDGRPLLDLERSEFTVFEDGEEQQIRRFEYMRDLPIHAGLLIDSSASMQDSLDEVSRAALAFVEQTLRPEDRLALISFNQRPNVETRFTSEPSEVRNALAGLRAIGGTALYDSLIYALNYFDGIKGQKALLLLSDGKDESSQFDFQAALDTAYKAGVMIYVVGLKEAARDRDAREILERVAEQTGGRSFFIEDPAELDAIYASIQEELRSQYLIAYQSTSTKDLNEFRTIRVDPERRGADVRTLAGYYP